MRSNRRQYPLALAVSNDAVFELVIVRPVPREWHRPLSGPAPPRPQDSGSGALRSPSVPFALRPLATRRQAGRPVPECQPWAGQPDSSARAAAQKGTSMDETRSLNRRNLAPEKRRATDRRRLRARSRAHWASSKKRGGGVSKSSSDAAPNFKLGACTVVWYATHKIRK